MASLKHVGRIKNTGRRCVVVFREMYNEKGVVVDENNCLVFESESLPEAEHNDLMRIIESGAAQSTGDLFEVLGRERLGSGVAALQWLSASNRLRKFPTNNVELTPDSTTILGLDTLNTIVKMQSAGKSQEEIENMLRDDTDQPPRVSEIVKEALDGTDVTNADATTQTGDGVLDDATIAANYLAQAEMFETQAKDLRAQAETLVPTAKPKRVRKTAPKKPANK
jgi:hypothetical protein